MIFGYLALVCFFFSGFFWLLAQILGVYVLKINPDSRISPRIHSFFKRFV